MEGYRDESIDPDAPLEIASGPTEWEFQRAVLAAVPDNPAETDIDGVYITKVVMNPRIFKGILKKKRI